MNIQIMSKSGLPIYEQIERGIKDAIVNGELNKGDLLPSIRSLAADLKISVITTKRAYENLEKEGMIYSVPGKGFFVDDPDLAYLLEKRNVGFEEDIKAIVAKAKAANMSKDDILCMLDVFWD